MGPFILPSTNSNKKDGSRRSGRLRKTAGGPSSIRSPARDAGRNLRRSPGFTVLAVLIMALGIGANTAVFSVVNAVLLKPLSYRDPDRIVTLSASLTSREPATALSKQVSIPDFQDWHDQSSSFDAMAY